MEIKINKKTKQIQLVKDGKVVHSLSENESIDFFDNMSEFTTSHDYLFNHLWATISKEELEMDLFPLNELEGIDIEMIWYHEDYSFCVDFDINFINDKTRTASSSENIDVYGNFSQQRFLGGKVTNHELRACFENEIIDHIRSYPDFSINFNNHKIKVSDFLDEKNTHYYKTGHFSDFPQTVSKP